MRLIKYNYSMETQQFTLFMDLIKTKSFSLTAKKHFRTQPAISIAIKRLENELGVQLLERKGHKIKLSPEGEALKTQMAEIIRLTNDLKFQASQLAKQPKGLVKIATVHSIGLYELSDTIRSFIKKYPDIRIHIDYEQSQKVYALVEEKEVDFGIVAYPVSSHAIEAIPMAEDKMVIIASPGADFSKKPEMSLKDLNGMNFVAYSEGIPTRHAIDRVLRQAGVNVEIRFENENIETLKKAVEVGIGVSIVPLKSVEREKQTGQLAVIKIKGQPLKRPIGIIKPRKYPSNKPADFFIKELLRRPENN